MQKDTKNYRSNRMQFTDTETKNVNKKESMFQSSSFKGWCYAIVLFEFEDFSSYPANGHDRCRQRRRWGRGGRWWLRENACCPRSSPSIRCLKKNTECLRIAKINKYQDVPPPSAEVREASVSVPADLRLLPIVGERLSSEIDVDVSSPLSSLKINRVNVK